MIEAWSVVALALGYVSALFALAWYADRTSRLDKGGRGRPLIYALSLAVYCTSWTFFGSVGLAASTGYSFIPVYLGPVLLFVFGWRFLLRIVRLAKSQNITSVADFLAARYGKSQAVAAIVTVIAVGGTLPYIALQLKAVAISVDALLGARPLQQLALPIDTAFIIALAMATFAVLFGTRHIDATEHQEGLIVAVAAESIVKLAAFLTVGFFVLFSVFGGLGGLVTRVMENPEAHKIFANGLHGSVWITVTFLSLVCILLLPRQFHVTVVENNSEEEIRRATWLFPVYLALINLFVVPIAAAGVLTLPKHSFDADTFVLALPLSAGAEATTLLAFVGGLSAATAMVIVDSVALAIMVSNGLVLPLLLRQREDEPKGPHRDMARLLLAIRRVAIFGIVLLGYVFYRALGQTHGLASIGLVSFAAIAQFAPAFFGGLIWRNATARGAIAGILTGFAVWAYTLLLPWVIEAGWIQRALMTEGPFGLSFLSPKALFYLQLEPLTHGVFWSIAANVLMFVTVSLMRAPEPVERLQARVFVMGDLPRPPISPAFRLWRTSVTAGDLQHTVARYLGTERAERSFSEFAESRDAPIKPDAEADIHLLRFTEHLLASAIGAASARLVLTLLLRRRDAGSQTALRLLDDASEALQYNRDLLQSALDQVRHGLSVFDKDMRLICWNRQFRELLDLPSDLGRVGAPLDRILRVCAERGDFGPGDVDRLVADRLDRLAVKQEAFQEYFDGGRRILEIRTSPMPQGGIVTTYSDITERVEAAEALARANETLERRVRERTAELTEVNEALAVAKRKADEANLDKTRFLAAASHDVLQPLNAARLYVTSLVERTLGGPEATLARNIDASLEAVEEILGVLIEISRLDAGRLEPDISVYPLNEVFERLEVEFAPLAREKALDLRILPTTQWVRSDRRLMRRVLQNLVSNAIKYTAAGRVLIGVRRRGDRLAILVCDTGPGIPQSKRTLIFKEFQRLEETASTVRGLGLGLSIVERIGRVLGHPIGLESVPGRGSVFSVELPRAAPRFADKPGETLAPWSGRMVGLNVLCIDNEPAVLSGMQTLLDGWGCRVVTAQSAAEAARRLDESRVVPDIILADYHLDDGTGLEAVAALRAASRTQAPVIVITADHSAQVQREVRLRGYALLRKPLKAAALRALMYQLTRQRAVAAE
ncbi:MAG TPA: PAS domain-containing hybrid sensor histidine kinase/response regulator [Hyphomicrobiaceae bacterium]|nr:PAS domain-containing hybrid sensor histidine kinase/response regulator [Hyphomicrobiaceae bacterium]